LAGLVTLAWVLTGQAAGPVRHGLPTDWSHRHLIFSRPATAGQLASVQRDPRYWQQLQRRNQAMTLQGYVADNSLSSASALRAASAKVSQKMHGDWSEDLGTGATVGAGNYPAKFSFDITTANCGNATTPDYAVFSTGLAGAVNQASIVAFDNLYSGCTGTVPSVYWAYNTAGQILTSPVLSRTGSQVAFVETNGGFGILVVLKWAASTGTVSSPATPTLVLPALYSACPAPCMTTILLRDALGTQTDDTTSSVFYDYTNDIAWVGGAGGWREQ